VYFFFPARIDARSDEVDRHLQQYVSPCWGPIMEVVRQTRYPASDKSKIKDLFTKFNKCWKGLHETQCQWAIADGNLTDRLRNELLKYVASPYAEFYR
jgi:hypothetical protein